MKEIIELSEKTVTLRRNDFLKLHGSIDQNVYYIQSGSMRVFVQDGEEEQVIRFRYTDNIIVPLDSFLTGKPSPLTIQALKKTIVKVITKSQVDEFISNKDGKDFWIEILEDLVLQQMEREVIF